MADAKVDIIISAKDQASPVFKKLGGSAADLAKTMAVGLAAGGAAVAAGLGAAVKTAADFDKQMSAIQAAAGLSKTAEQMGQLSQKALQLGQDTSKSASEAAAGIEELIKAGIPVDAVLNGAAEAAINLSEATGTDVATAAEVAAAAMATFGKTGEEMAAVTDTVTGAVNNSKMGVADFALGIAAAGTSVAAAGGSFEDTATALTAMSKAGLSGSDAGTSLKNMYTSLAAPTKEATKVMRELGVVTADGRNKFFDARGSVKSYAEIAGVLEDALAGMTDKQKLATLETLFGRDAQRAALIAAELGVEGANALGEAVNRQGQAAEGAAARMDNLAGDIEKLGGSLETAAISLGSAFQEPLRQATQAITAFVNDNIIPFINEYGPAFAEAISAAGKSLATGAGSLLESAKKAANDGIQFLRDKLADTGKEWAPWAAQAGDAGKAVGAALTGASGALLALQFVLQGNFKAAIAEGKKSLEEFGTAADTSASSVDRLRKELEKMPTTVRLMDELGKAAESLRRSFDNLGQFVPNLIENILRIGGAGKDAAADFDLMTIVLMEILRPIKTILGAFELFTAALVKVGDVANAISDGLGNAFGEALKAAHEWSNGSEQAVRGAVEGMLGAIGQWLADMTSSIGSGLAGALAAVDQWVADLQNNIRSGIASTVSEAYSQALAVGASIVSGLIGGIQARAGEVASAARALVTNAINSARAALGAESPSKEFIDIGEDVDEGFAIGIEEGIADVEQAAAELAEAAIDAVTEELEQGAPEAEVAAIDLGQTVVDALAAGLGKVKTLEGAADTLKGTVAGAMRDLAADIDRINSELDRKFAEVGQRAGRAIETAVREANDSVRKTITDAAEKIQDLQTNLLDSRALRSAREALTGRLGGESLAREQRREEEDIQREREREDKRNAEQLQRDIEKARTAEEVAGLIDRASEAQDDLRRRRKAEDEDRAYRRKREDEDRDFRKQQEQAVRDFEDDLEDKALVKSIARAEQDRDNRIQAINDALEEKKQKIEEDARYEQQQLAESARDRIQTLKDDFIAKLPGLTSQASAIVEQFLAGIDQALQRTASLAAATAAAIGSIGGGGGGGGGGAADTGQAIKQFTIPLEGGGEMHVNASDLTAALENVVQQGGTPKADETRFVREFEHGGVVPGREGEAQWAIVHGGETVIPNGARLHGASPPSGNVTLVLEIDGRAFASAIAPYTEGRVVLRAL